MAAKGPVPKRSEQRRRVNKPVVEPTKAPAVGPMVPRSKSTWHPIAKRWYESLGRSGQSIWYADSDWALAYATAESMSREFNPQPVTTGRGDDRVTELIELPPKPAAMMAWLKACSQLLATEGDRRRVAIELQRDKPKGEDGDGDVEWIVDARNRLRGAG